jgi:hypothetical protein
MASRQERRKAERDAAKRTPGQAVAGAVGGAAAAGANVNMNPVGDWTTQTVDPFAFEALGDDIVKERAGSGDREAQWSLGYSLMCEDGVVGRGLHSSTFQLNLSALYGIGGACGGCVARVFRVCKVFSCDRHGSS